MSVNTSRLPTTAQHHPQTADVIADRDIAARTTVPILRIFDRFKNMRSNNIQSDSNLQEKRPPNDLPTEHSRGHTRSTHNEVNATNNNLTTNVHRRKTTHSLPTAMFKEASSSRNTKRQSISSSKRTPRNRNHPPVNSQIVRPNPERRQGSRYSRTARDRCNDGEILGFKTRLYNIGGMRGYKLPTSDILGGIVFESGLRSRIDFDVIIEFRGGPPQRINKLHQSYMSLEASRWQRQGQKVTMNAYYKYQLH
ncbi:hypothetical protein Tco_0469103 [Tanacetum coccineum]